MAVEGGRHFVFCHECKALGPTTETEAEAIAAWNRRTPVDLFPFPAPKPNDAKWVRDANGAWHKSEADPRTPCPTCNGYGHHCRDDSLTVEEARRMYPKMICKTCGGSRCEADAPAVINLPEPRRIFDESKPEAIQFFSTPDPRQSGEDHRMAAERSDWNYLPPGGDTTPWKCADCGNGMGHGLAIIRESGVERQVCLGCFNRLRAKQSQAFAEDVARKQEYRFVEPATMEPDTPTVVERK